MFSNVFGILVTAWNSVYSWTVSLFNSMSAAYYVLGAIFAMFAVRFLVYPFMKSRVAGSDTAKAFKEDYRDFNDAIDADFREV